MRLTIHIGAFKTATSAAQISLGRGGWRLRRANIAYAQTGRNAGLSKHLHLYDHIVHDEANHERHLEHADIDYFAALRDELVDSRRKRLVVSEEELSRPDPSIARFFAPLQDVADVDIVFVVRAQPEFMESLYLQFMTEPRRRLVATFEDFWSDPQYAAYGDFAGVIAPWADAFGDDAITVLDFDHLRRSGSAVASLFSAIGIPPKIATDRQVNTSISPVTAELLRRIAVIDPALTRRRLIALLKERDTTVGATIVDERQRAAIEEHFSGSNRALRARFGVDPSTAEPSRREVLPTDVVEARALCLAAELIDVLWSQGRRVHGREPAQADRSIG